MGEFTIGIDLGTTYSCVGAWRNGKVEIIPNEQGNRITPSCVSFDKDKEDRLVGEGAKNLAAANPTNTIFDAKRLIGRRFEDETVKRNMSLWPFKVVASKVDDKPRIVVKHNGEEKLFVPEEISAMVLAKMKKISEKFLGCEVKKAVVTVPAYFNDSQRRSTKDAGKIAGLDVIRIINEPTAAALAYCSEILSNKVKYKKTVLVFDLGGGTFDVSLLEMEDDIVTVKATAGDTHLGGQDFNNRMMEILFDSFKEKHGMDKSREARLKSRLVSKCEEAKRSLSFLPTTNVYVDCLYEGFDLNEVFTRAKFEDLNMDLFGKCITILEGCLKEAKVDKSRVDDVILVGGSTRIPKVQDMLSKFFNRKALCNSIHVDEAVAYGAAILAHQLRGKRSLAPQIVLKDVAPISLGFRKSNDTMAVVIPRNSPIPVEKSMMTCTVKDNQTKTLYEIYEGERSMAKQNNFLGCFIFEGITPGPAYANEIRLIFNLDADGLLSISSTDLASGNKITVTITNDIGRLKPEEINRMIADAERYRFEDDKRRKKAEARTELESFAYTTRNAVRDPNNASKLSKIKISEVEVACVDTIKWCEQNDASADEYDYQDKKKKLKEQWKEIIVKLGL